VITGAHALIYAKDADKVRAFFKDVLGLRSVDAGGGWLIFALPPAEVGVHPAEDEEEHHELYLMCKDVHAAIRELKAKGVKCSPVHEADWGLATMIEIPGGGAIGMYQPKHPTAIRI
jgi:catechol 2,3-dioxygenase-like lactoylglutathione lyase family enzyme